MTLTNRVSLFFLAALATVLLVFSVLIYGVANLYLSQQVDQQLLATFNTLVAAVEVEVDDVKFEPSDHTIAMLAGANYGQIHWLIRDETGQVIESSPSLRGRQTDDPAIREMLARPAAPVVEEWNAGPFRLAQLTLKAPEPKPASERELIEHEAITVTALIESQTIAATLRWLAIALAALSCVSWLITAVIGRWYVHKALRPVGQMAQEARALRIDDARQRLPVAQSNDELEDLGLAFNSLLDRLHDALESEQRFTGDAAHQLRTPVTVLLGQIEVARRRPRTLAEHEELLTLLQSQAVELRQLIEAMLFLARAGNDQQQEFERLELNLWLSDHLRSWQRQPRGKDLQIELATDHAVAVKVLPTLLGQLVDNLVENAFKYTPPGTPVRVSLLREAAHVTIAVEDEGPGIATKELPHIFTPFYRSPAARQAGVPGTGLGLSVAARIAALLGGSLTADAQRRVGCGLRIRLPLAN
ncbi:MAG TPA: ATP-binding protein [Pirellulaceae bacterium]|nr:ATP-binding protein [Pirellulaceae bacterium]